MVLVRSKGVGVLWAFFFYQSLYTITAKPVGHPRYRPQLSVPIQEVSSSLSANSTEKILLGRVVVSSLHRICIRTVQHVLVF
jgi:hypothetical protein